MKLLKFDADATGFDKFISYFAVIFCSLWVLYVYLAIWGVFPKSTLAIEANKASAGAHTLGFVFLLIFLVSLAGIYFDRLPFKLGNMGKVGLVAVSLLLSIALYCGFWVAI